MAPRRSRLCLVVKLVGAGDALVELLLAHPRTAAVDIVHLGFCLKKKRSNFGPRVANLAGRLPLEDRLTRTKPPLSPDLAGRSPRLSPHAAVVAERLTP